MVPGGSTESFWYFAGYLRLYDDIWRPRVSFEDGPGKHSPDDYKGKKPFFDAPPAFLDLETQPLDVSPLDPLTGTAFPRIQALQKTAADPMPDAEIDPLPRAKNFVPKAMGAGGGGGDGASPAKAKKEISVTYEEGGNQALVQIHQHNEMLDDDVLLVNGQSPALSAVDIDCTLDRMTDAVNAKAPDDVAIPTEGGTAALIEFIEQRDAQIATEGGSGYEPVAAGRYVNNELLPEPEADSETPPAANEPEPPAQTAGAYSQWADLGANHATNAAVIVDVNEAVRTMIVIGDYYETNAIIQANALRDHDEVHVAGANGTDGPYVATAGNEVDNIAEFLQHDGVFGSRLGAFSGFQWHVDVVDGDFYDVNYLRQTNVLRDNDIVVQDTQASNYSVIAGENEALNLTKFFAMAQQYDVIIVLGDMHVGNYILQSNIVLDPDIVKMLALEGGPLAAGGDLSQYVTTGQNGLVNDATIESYGGDNPRAIGQPLYDLVDALGDQASTFNPAQYGYLLPGNGSGVLNVLYVTGDYYDINAIWQRNVLADLDTAMQYFSGEVGAPIVINAPDQGEGVDGVVQYVNAGGNVAKNLAGIVDANATNLFVGGDSYEDAILIQAEIVDPSRPDQVVYGDTQSLVPELIAFTDAPVAAEPEDDPLYRPAQGSAADDLMGGLVN